MLQCNRLFVTLLHGLMVNLVLYTAEIGVSETFPTDLPDGEIIFENQLKRPDRADASGTKQFMAFPLLF